jgi:oligopeptide/dipeptide ABC transporter ATP-binding protein
MIQTEKKSCLLEVNNLRTSFFTNAGEVKAVDDVSYHINRGEVVAIVGESGCGKSVTQMSVIQLIQMPPGKILGGEVIFDGEDLLQYPPNSREIRAVRGAGISMIFQEPMTSLNPVLTVGNQLAEVLCTHKKVNKKQAWQLAIKALESVGIPDPKIRVKNYPFEMSGGMRQRVMIATAMACNSKLIIADEPTTALDVTTQAQVMELLLNIVNTYGTALLLVTHNLGLVTRYTKRIYVMYAGKIVESGPTREMLTQPQHPYTIGLLRSVPRLDEDKDTELVPIGGAPPVLTDLPPGCAFAPRCSYACDICRQGENPPLRQIPGKEHYTSCHLEIEGGNL